MPCPCVCTLPHVSPVRAQENRKMNRSKYIYSTTAQRQCRAGEIDQESKRTTINTERELDESLVSTVKNSTLAREAALQPIEEQRNPQIGMQLICSPEARGQPDIADGSEAIPAIMTSAIAFIWNPLAAVFRPAASGPDAGGEAVLPPLLKHPALPPTEQTKERFGDTRGAADSASTKFNIEEKGFRLPALPSVFPVSEHSSSATTDSTDALTGSPAARYSSDDLQRGSNSCGMSPGALRRINAQKCGNGTPVPPSSVAPAAPAALYDNASANAGPLESVFAPVRAESAIFGTPVRGADSAPTESHRFEGASGVSTLPLPVAAG